MLFMKAGLSRKRTPYREPRCFGVGGDETKETPMNEEETKKKGFSVVDRRRFDTDGNSVEEASSRIVTAGPAVDVSGRATPKSGERVITPEVVVSANSGAKGSSGLGPTMTGEHESPLPDDGRRADIAGNEEINFSSFVMSLATQALMQLGEIPPPPGVSLHVDVGAAQQSIDILTMLEQKTKGNLDQAEAQLLEEILHQLRVSFLRRRK